MRKVLSSLIVLAILVGMFVCLGTQALAAQEDIAVFAVTDEQLSSDTIARLQEQCTGALVIDANGFAEGQDQAGYNVAWVEQDPVVMSMTLTEAAKVWPGFAVRQEVGPNFQNVIVVGVGETTTADEVANAINGATVDGTEFIVAVGPAAAAEAVKNQVKVFLATGETDGAISDLEGTKLVHIGKDGAPIAAVFVNAEGEITAADNMPLPVAGDPNVGALEPQVQDPNVGAGEPQIPLYDVIYSGNGGAGAVQDDFDFQSDLEYYFRQNGYTAPEGYEFGGWKIDGDESGTIYQPNDSIYLDRDITVLAQWNQIVTSDPAADGNNDLGVGLGGGPVVSVVTITFDANGGTGTMEPMQVAVGVDNPVPGNGFTPPAGMKFDHWVGSDWVDYYVGEPINIQDNVTLQAQWVTDTQPVPDQTFTITYLPGEAAGCQQVQDTWAPDTPIGLSKPADWTYEGHTLTGWTKDGESYGVDEQYYVTGDATFTAVWTADVATVNANVTYKHGEHGTGDDVTVPVENIGAGVSYTLLAECPFQAEEGYRFTGWAVEGDTSATLLGQYTLTGDVAFVAQWEQITQEPATWTVNFYSGAETAEGTMEPAKVNQGDKLELPSCAYTVAGMTFAGWQIGADTSNIRQTGEQIDVAGDMDLYATWKQVFTVTYKPGDEAAAENADLVVSEAPAAYVLVECPFKAPAGKTFSNWSIGGAPYDAGATVTLTDNIEVIAVWKDAPVDNQTATTKDGNTIPWTRGDTDKPTVTFDNAQIATVSIAGIQLTEEKADVEGKSVTLEPNYLNTLDEGNYNMTVTFQKDDNGGTFNPYIMTISVTVPPAVSPEASPASRTIQMDWARTGNWTYTFDKAPTEVKIYYGTSNGQPVYQIAKAGTDYTVSGNTLTLLPAMINGNWGGQWPNATYSFLVTLNNDANDVYTLQLKLTGDAPATTVAPTATPASNSNVPVTGDETPLVLYIVILVVLIAALATVLIIVMKRRNSGSRGRH